MVSHQQLGDLRFFQDLPVKQLEQIAGMAELTEIGSGGQVFREGERSNQIHVVQTGRVSLEIRVPGKGTVQIQTVGPGELLGWSPMLGEGPMTASARAIGSCHLVSFRAPQLLALMEQDPRLGMELMKRTSRALSLRLNATRLQLLDIYRQELPATSGEGGQV